MKHTNKWTCCFLLMAILFAGCSSISDNQESETYERLTIVDFAATSEAGNGKKISIIWKGHEFTCPVVFQSVPDSSSLSVGFRKNENTPGYELEINGHHLPIKTDTEGGLYCEGIWQDFVRVDGKTKMIAHIMLKTEKSPKQELTAGQIIVLLQNSPIVILK